MPVISTGWAHVIPVAQTENLGINFEHLFSWVETEHFERTPVASGCLYALEILRNVF